MLFHAQIALNWKSAKEGRLIKMEYSVKLCKSLKLLNVSQEFPKLADVVVWLSLQPPSATLVVKGLSQKICEDDLYQALVSYYSHMLPNHSQ